MPGSTDDADLARLVSHRYVVETLDALTEAPRTRRELQALLRAPQRRLATSLRVLAAQGVIRRCGEHGSWDDGDPADVLYELTDTGRRIAEQLDQFDVWVALYERYLYRDATTSREEPR